MIGRARASISLWISKAVRPSEEKMNQQGEGQRRRAPCEVPMISVQCLRLRQYNNFPLKPVPPQSNPSDKQEFRHDKHHARCAIGKAIKQGVEECSRAEETRSYKQPHGHCVRSCQLKIVRNSLYIAPSIAQGMKSITEYCAEPPADHGGSGAMSTLHLELWAS